MKFAKEVETVKNWVTQLNGKGLTSENGSKININSLFIHGFNHSEKGSHPSGVEFDYYDKNNSRKELADIIFISSFYYKDKKVLEKVTFNQVKWGEIKSTTSSWKIDQGQLYLLSRLPRFNGVKNSIIPNKDYYIENISKCLTSYGLMNKENFIFISTYHLLTAMGGKKSINLKDFQSLNSLKQNMQLRISFIDDNIFYFKLFIEKCCNHGPYCLNIFNKLFASSSVYFTNNTFEFLSEYLKGNIGEIIHNNITTAKNNEASTLVLDIMKNIKTYAEQTENDKIKKFINNYTHPDIIDSDNSNNIKFDNGLGIVQTKIDLS